MNTDSFTDEQLLNLVNNTIETKTEFTRNDFTGGAVIVTTTHNNTIKKFKVSLYFGYKGKHSINRQIEISRESYYVWSKAILIKVFSLDMANVGMDLNELNSLMNNMSISNTSNSSEFGDTPVPTTVPKKDKPFSFTLSRLTSVENLSKSYLTHLKDYIEESNKSLSYEDFINGLESKGNKYKNFKSAYNTWAKNTDNWKASATDGKGMKFG